MIRTSDTVRSLLLATMVVFAATVGAITASGAVGAQDAGDNDSDGNASAADQTEAQQDASFYSPSEEEPLNVRFRDCCANTVESVAEGILNLNIVYGLFDGPYDVEISASGLSDEQVDDITFGDDTDYPPNDLGRTDIVGMDFSGVPAGQYEFTLSVVGADARATLPIEVTDDEATADEPSANGTTNGTDTDGTGENETTTGNATGRNETTDTAVGNATDAGNETEMGNASVLNESAGNASIVATPDTVSTNANYTVTARVGAGSAGNLTAVTIDYNGSNANLARVGPRRVSAASISGENVTGNVTRTVVRPNQSQVLVGFDGTRQVDANDTVSLVFDGVRNPPVADTYNVSVDVNPRNGSDPSNATLTIGENATVTAVPDTVNATANYTVASSVREGSTGNLTAVAVNYTGTNASLARVGPRRVSAANVSGENVSGNVTGAFVRPNRSTVVVRFDGTRQIDANDTVSLTYGGVRNPPTAGAYNVSVDVNPRNGSDPNNATLGIRERVTGSASVTPLPDTANASANHTVVSSVNEGSAGNLTAVAVNYTGTNTSVDNISPERVRAAGISGEDVTANVSTTIIGADGATAIITFDETRQVDANDTVSLVFGGVRNPPTAGTYNVSVDVNPENGSDPNDATFGISENTSAGGVNATQTETTDDGRANATTDAGANASGGQPQQTTEEAGPGFGVIAAVVALLAAALLATRRRV